MLYKNNISWKEKMNTIYRNHCNAKSRNLTEFYLALETIANECIRNNEMSEGEEYTFRLALLGEFKIKFYYPYSEIYTKNENTNEWNQLLSKEQSANIEYNQVLRYYERILDDQGLCFGDAYPSELREYLSSCQPGELISFKDGNTYLCVDKKGDKTFLQRKYISDELNLQEDEIFAVPIRDIDLQKFYQNNRVYLTNSVEVSKIQLESHATTYFNRICKSLEKNDAVTVHIGPHTLHAKKKIFSNDIKWLDESGEKISRETVQFLLGKYQTNTIKQEYFSKKESLISRYNIIKCQSDIEDALNNGEMSLVFDIIENYVTSAKGNLEIVNKGYIDQNNDYIAVGYVFVYENNKCNIRKVHYRNNDIDDIQIEDSAATKAEFIRFYEKKYGDNVSVIKNKNIAALSIKERDTSVLSQAKQNIATNLANKNVEVNPDRTIIQHRFVDDENIKIRVPETDISNIVRSYTNQNKPKKTAKYIEDYIRKETEEELEL